MNRTVSLPRLLPAGLALCLSALILPAQAQLFGGDDEARRAIIDLRGRVEANRQAAADADARLEKAFKALMDSFRCGEARSICSIRSKACAVNWPNCVATTSV